MPDAANVTSLPSSTTAHFNHNAQVFDWYVMPEAYSAPLVEDAIHEFGVRKGETVLDPFCGTGTTLLAARLMGRNALGIEVNPFLCFASQVKNRHHFNLTSLKLESERLLVRAGAALTSGDAAMQGWVERLPQMPRLERWMARRVALKVVALRACIEECVSPANRDVPMLALASILRGASNMKLSPHAFGSREIKQDAPVLVMFEARLRKMLADIEWLEGRRGLGRASVVEGDVRQMGGLQHPLLPARLIIGSPPYLNNLDYTMQTRMELFFLLYVDDMEGLKRLRKRMMVCDAKATYKEIEDWRRVEEVPAVREVAQAIDDKLGDRGWGWDYGRMTRQYFGGLVRALEALRPHLAPGGKLVLIVGESAHAGVLVAVPDLLAQLAPLAGFPHVEVRPLRTRRSSSHSFSLKESAVVLSKE